MAHDYESYTPRPLSERRLQRVSGKSPVDQAARRDTDINRIMKAVSRTGVLPPARSQPVYGDVSGALDYQATMNQIRLIDEAFLRLPSEVRAKFDNNPQKLDDFLRDPENLEEARKLGLRPPKREVKPPARPKAGEPLYDAVRAVQEDLVQQSQTPPKQGGS